MSGERKRVLFLVPSLIGGGAQRVFSTLLRHLDRLRFEPHLGVLRPTGVYLKDIPQDVGIHDLKVARVRYAAPSIVRFIRELHPDTVLSTLGHLNLTLMAIKPLLPRQTRLLIREAAVASSFLEMEVQHPAVWRWAYRYLYRRADKIICLSDTMVEDMATEFRLPRAKLVRIYNPVDAGRVQQLAEEQEDPYPDPGARIVAVGRLCRQKGYDILMDAMPAVLQQAPDARLAILGEGPLEAELKQQSRRLRLDGAVEFLGFQQNPWPYVKHADVFVLPSRYEGLPNVLLEALALGRPAVVTDCPGAMREIRDPHLSMELVPPEDPHALAAAVLRALGGRAIPHSDPVAKPEYLQRFSVERAVQEYSALF
jgi:glycosyltransferase involved in cell wall biosynthesis